MIPKETLFKPDHDQAFEFFNRTIGHVTSGEAQTRAICGSFRALSAIGNVIVFTFTAARVKQEVAKEGVLPFSLFFASSYSFSFRHGFRRMPPSRSSYQLHTSRAPAAALALHWAVTCILIIAVVFGTARAPTAFAHVPAYYLVLAAYAYGLDIIWFSCIGVAMVVLRLWPGSKWRYKSPVPHGIGTAAAVIFAVTNLFPLIAIWIPDPAEAFLSNSEQMVPWFAGQAFAFAVLAAGVLYWVGFRTYVYLRKTKNNEKLEITRIPIFFKPTSSGEEKGKAGDELVLLYEIIKQRWPLYKTAEQSRESPAAERSVRAGGDPDTRVAENTREQNPSRMSGGRLSVRRND